MWDLSFGLQIVVLSVLLATHKVRATNLVDLVQYVYRSLISMPRPCFNEAVSATMAQCDTEDLT